MKITSEGTVCGIPVRVDWTNGRFSYLFTNGRRGSTAADSLVKTELNARLCSRSYDIDDATEIVFNEIYDTRLAVFFEQ